MEVVVTTGAVRRAKLPSNVTTYKPTPSSFYRPDALPVAQPTSVKALKGNQSIVDWLSKIRESMCIIASVIHRCV